MSQGVPCGRNPSHALQYMKHGRRSKIEWCLDIGLGYVGAARLLTVGVSYQSVGASSRPPTNLLELTCAAFTFQLRRISQALKQRRVTVNLGQFLLAYVTRRERHKPAGKHLTCVRDEYEPFTVVQASRRSANGISLSSPASRRLRYRTFVPQSSVVTDSAGNAAPQWF